MPKVTSVKDDPDLINYERRSFIDKKFPNDLTDRNYSNSIFLRLSAKERSFKNIDFRYCIFDSCYLRDASFDTCNFIGCRFISTNLHGATFDGCQFDYATFEHTSIDESILKNSCPAFENVRMRFARSLRVNYKQLGDSRAVNSAVRVELDAYKMHLWKAWRSTETYHRKKYKGFLRFNMFLQWLRFKVFDWIWGNGESLAKLGRFVCLILLTIGLLELVFSGNTSLRCLGSSLLRSFPIFFGVISPPAFSDAFLTTFVLARLICFGLFMAILLKRLDWR